MRIEISVKDDVAIMRLSGQFLAGSDGPYLRQKVKDLVDAGSKMLVINFSEVPHIDSTGLGFLAGSRTTTQDAGVSVVLAGVNQHVRNTLERVKLLHLFTLAGDEAGAITRVRELGRSASAPSEKSRPGPKHGPHTQ